MLTAAAIWTIVSLVLTFGVGAAAFWLKADIKRTREALLAKSIAAAKTPSKEDDAAVAAEALAVADRLRLEEMALAAANEGSVARVIDILKPGGSFRSLPGPSGSPGSAVPNEVGTPRKPKP